MPTFNMPAVQMLAYPVEAGYVELQLMGLSAFLESYGEVGKVQLCAALTTLILHIQHGSSYIPPPETVQ